MRAAVFDPWAMLGKLPGQYQASSLSEVSGISGEVASQSEIEPGAPADPNPSFDPPTPWCRPRPSACQQRPAPRLKWPALTPT